MKMLFAGLPILLLASCCASLGAESRVFGGATPLEWSQRLAQSEMARRGDSLQWKPDGKAKWDYAAGLFTMALLKLDQAEGQGMTNPLVKDSRADQSLRARWVQAAIGSFIAEDGKIRTYNQGEFQLDSLNSGKTALALWRLTHEPRYRRAAETLRSQLAAQPRTYDGGFWHKQRYTNQMWLDGIFMAAPFYAECGQIFNQPGAFDDVARQVSLIDEHTYDPRTGLNYHGWDAAKIQVWANPVTGCSSNFWGRAEGWYAMALVDILDYMPKDHPARGQIIALIQKTARGVLKWQDAKTGLWWQVMDQGGRRGNYLEASASAMFLAALAKGMNQGYLSRDYLSAVERGYSGIIQNLVIRDAENRWSLTQCCSVAGLGGSPSNGAIRDGSFNYYIHEPVVANDLKAIGPFILSGIELEKLIDSHP